MVMEGVCVCIILYKWNYLIFGVFCFFLVEYYIGIVYCRYFFMVVNIFVLLFRGCLVFRFFGDDLFFGNLFIFK